MDHGLQGTKICQGLPLQDRRHMLFKELLYAGNEIHIQGIFRKNIADAVELIV